MGHSVLPQSLISLPFTSSSKANQDLVTMYLYFSTYIYLTVCILVYIILQFPIATGFCNREIQNDTILNLIYDWPETLVGQTATTTCFEGSSTMATRSCSASGNFTAPPNTLSCVDCGPLSAPENGNIVITPTGSTGFASFAFYSCFERYSLSSGNNNMRICGNDATWSGEDFLCISK